MSDQKDAIKLQHTENPEQVYLDMRKAEEEKWSKMTVADIFPPIDTREKKEIATENQKLRETIARQTDLIAKLNEEIIILAGRINGETNNGKRVTELTRENQRLKEELASHTPPEPRLNLGTNHHKRR